MFTFLIFVLRYRIVFINRRNWEICIVVEFLCNNFDLRSIRRVYATRGFANVRSYTSNYIKISPRDSVEFRESASSARCACDGIMRNIYELSATRGRA